MPNKEPNARGQAAAKLQRTTFTVSRELEYFTEKELDREIGDNVFRWPLLITKELIDNALDACETGTAPPEITVTLDGTRICVADNGPGLPESTLTGSLNYLTRTSDKAHYVAPTRGQIGNALKCLWAAPFVYSGVFCDEQLPGRIRVITSRYACEIVVAVDKIAQKPILSCNPLDREFVKTGTSIEIEWESQTSSIPVPSRDFYKSGDSDGFDEDEDEPDEEDEENAPPRTFADDLRFLVGGFATFNPHATFHLCLDGETVTFAASLPNWQKWRTDDLTSPHWYTADDLRTLIAGHISAQNGTKTVRELVSEFRGLTGTAKQTQVVNAAGLNRQCMNDLITDDNIDMAKVGALLRAMQEASRPVKAVALGLIGEEVLKKQLAEIDGVVPEKILYYKLPSNNAKAPTLIEIAFGPQINESNRQVRLGLNCSPAKDLDLIKGLETYMQYQLHVDPDATVSMAVHVMRPGVKFTSRAKSEVV